MAGRGALTFALIAVATISSDAITIDHWRHEWRKCDMEILRELWAYMGVRKKFWLLPIFIMLGVFGALLVLTQGTAVAPFIYTLF